MGSALPTMRESLRGSRAPLPPLGSGHQEERVVREGGAGEREPVGHGDAVLGLAAPARVVGVQSVEAGTEPVEDALGGGVVEDLGGRRGLPFPQNPT